MSETQLPEITNPTNIQQLVDWTIAYGLNPEPLLTEGTINFDGYTVDLDENKGMLWVHFPARGSGLFFETNPNQNSTLVTPVYAESLWGQGQKEVETSDDLKHVVDSFLNFYPVNLQEI